MLKRLVNKWKSYRHRFVPWMMFNLSNNERTLRQVPDHSKDKLVPDEEVLDSLLLLARALLHKHVAELPSQTRTHFLTYCTEKIHEGIYKDGPVTECDIMFKTLGFCIDKRPSSLPSAGAGVFVTKGLVPKGTTVAMYPGTIYQAYEPIFIQSIRNPFVFRCIDGIFIDGNDKGISKIVYRSCSGRDRIGPFQLCDSSWLTPGPIKNPLAMGQYVNNCSNEWSANVCYQEFDVPYSFPVELRQYLPNVNYTHEVQRPLRCVVLISLRDIRAGEELFSNYYTIVH